MNGWQKIINKLGEKQELNAEQCQALAALHNLSVVAAAGSGKTRVLTTKYLLHLLADSTLRPANIVAITFTENAAAEMRQRIRKLISKLMADESFKEYHQRLCDIKMWITLANISTIHSFCRGILAEYPLEAGIAPGFTTTEESTQSINLTELREFTLREINEGMLTGVSAEDCVFLARHFTRKHLVKLLEKIFNNWAKLDAAIKGGENWTLPALLAQRNTKDEVPAEMELHSIHLLARVVKNALKRYEEQKLRSFSVDFDDLLMKTARLLSENPAIQSYLAKRFRYFLIDEFQDTNPLQWEIVRKICGNERGGINLNKIFIVGDPKQSIYGFRDADVRIFVAACEELNRQFAQTNHKAEVLMNKNYRARPCLIDFTNYLFSNLMAAENNSATETYAMKYQPLSFSRQLEDEFPGGVEFLLNTGEDSPYKIKNKKESKYQKETELIAARINEIVNGINIPVKFSYKDIAILLRWKTHLNELEATLRRYKIPYVSVGGIGFYSRQEVWDIYNLMRFLLDQNDDIALAGILRSPFFAFDDNLLYKIAQAGRRERTLWERLNAYQEVAPELFLSAVEKENIYFALETLTTLIGKAAQADVATLIEDALERTGYLASASTALNSKYILANIEKTLSLAQSGDSLAELAERLKPFIDQRIRESEAQPELTEEDAVSIMTVHQAKGREFPVVFLPFLDWQFFKPRGDEKIYIDTEFFAGFKIRLPLDKMKFTESSFYRICKEKEEQRFIEEEKRLLYVGITRAMDYLVLSATYKFKGENPPGKKSGKSEAKSPFDWLTQRMKLNNAVIDAGRLTFTEAGRQWEIPVRTEIKPMEAAKEEQLRCKEEPLMPLPKVEQLRGFLSPISPLAEEIHISLSEIEELKEAGVGLRQRKLCGINREIIREKLLTAEDKPRELAMLRGSIVHKCLELLVANPQVNVEKIMQNEISLHPELSEQERSDLYTSVLRLVEKFRRSDSLKELESARKKFVELPFKVKLAENIIVSGKIDLLYQSEEDLWQLMDFKTDSLEGINGSLKEYAQQNYGQQLLCYALFMWRAFPQQRFYPTALYFITADELVKFTYNASQLEQEERNLIDKIFSNL